MLRTFLRDTKGFTVAELVTVMAILAVLAAIAIPLTLNQRASANETAQRADLTIAVSKVQDLLIGYNGIPPADIFVTTSNGTWSAAADGELPVLTGTLSTNTTISGTVWTDGSWCVDSTDQETFKTFSYQSDIAEITEDGICPTSALGGIGTTITSSPLSLPGQVSGISIDTTIDYEALVSWSAAPGADSYTVVVVGQTTTTEYGTSANLTGLLPGEATIIIYALNNDGAGQPVTITTTINGQTELQALTDRVTQAELDLLDALARIDALEQSAP